MPIYFMFYALKLHINNMLTLPLRPETYTIYITYIKAVEKAAELISERQM